MDLDAEFARFTAELKSVEETVAAEQAAAPPPLAPPPVRPPPKVTQPKHLHPTLYEVLACLTVGLAIKGVQSTARCECMTAGLQVPLESCTARFPRHPV
jgi:hypothetical protein